MLIKESIVELSWRIAK